MTRLQQIVIGFVALTVIFWLMPAAPGSVISTASGLPDAFNPVGKSQSILAAAALPITSNRGGLSVLGAPTITVEQIEAVLAEYNSPARGHGQEIYDLGVKYGINPAICLAFFIHESSAGTNPAWAGRKPDGSTTHNIGNIICTEGWRCYGRFRDYDNWSQGIEDWYKLIRGLYIDEWKRSTVEDIIPKYAPAADNNNEGAYIQSVKNLVQSWQGK
ncbi:MAG TPA: glucosaminidase domain-containing protein [Herpetosiphonaceae bacterium]